VLGASEASSYIAPDWILIIEPMPGSAAKGASAAFQIRAIGALLTRSPFWQVPATIAFALAAAMDGEAEEA